MLLSAESQSRATQPILKPKVNLGAQMNWDAAGAIGEIVGALAVVMSLIYLASQIRIQNREAKISSVHDITEAFRLAIWNLDEGSEKPLTKFPFSFSRLQLLLLNKNFVQA